VILCFRTETVVSAPVAVVVGRESSLQIRRIAGLPIWPGNRIKTVIVDSVGLGGRDASALSATLAVDMSIGRKLEEVKGGDVN
jgi:hypothetical protein